METKRREQTEIIKLDQAEVINPRDIKLLEDSMEIYFRRGFAKQGIIDLIALLESNPEGALSKEQVAGSLRALKGLKNREYFDFEDYSYLKNAFSEEGKIARINWAKKTEGLTRFAKASSKTLIAAITLFSVGQLANSAWGDIYRDYFSPEGVAKHQDMWDQREADRRARNLVAQQEAEAQKRIEDEARNALQAEAAAKKQAEDDRKRAEALKKEAAATLGLDWSATSGYNWRFRYLTPNPNIDYEEVLVPRGDIRVASTYKIAPGLMPGEIVHNGVDGTLNVIAQIHKRIDGRLVPKLEIITAASPYPSVLLRPTSESTSEIDARVVHAFDVGLGRERWFKIEVDTGDSGLRVVMMRPVTKNRTS